MVVTELDGFKVYQFEWQVVHSNAYVLCNKKSCLIVDPIDSKEFYQFVQEIFTDLKQVDALILLSHSHYDHISGLNRLRDMLPRHLVLSSKACSDNIQNPKKNLSNIASSIIEFQGHMEHKENVDNLVKSFTCEPADVIFENLFQMEWERHALRLEEYRGHSEDSVCCVIDDKYMFSGDTLLPIPTVTRLPGGSTEKFWKEDMPKLIVLSEQIDLVFPGHGMPGKMKDMLAVNKKPTKYRLVNEL